MDKVKKLGIFLFGSVLLLACVHSYAKYQRKTLVKEINNTFLLQPRDTLSLSTTKFNLNRWIAAFSKLRAARQFYSQAGEDLVLSIVFAHKIKEKGFYIDVGAHTPNDGTVTKYFYEKGWNGINIEPLKKFYEQLKKYRPNDINLNTAISNEPQELTFYEVTNCDGFSTADPEEVKKLKAAGNTLKEYKVQADTLDHVIEKYAKNKEITFLKIDVEGHERQVLLSIDLKKYRPQVICIEATYPASEKPSHYLWHDILEKADYLFAYFDGLNRYYVRKESKELLSNFEAVKSIMTTLQAYN